MRMFVAKTRLHLASVVALFFAWPAAAQEWDWSVTPYVWGTGIQGDMALGALARDVDVEFSEILDVLSGTALFHVEAARGEHILFGDLVWLQLEPDDGIATIGGVAQAELDSTIIELGYARDREGLGFEVGLRYWDLDMEIDPALLPGFSGGDRWTDVFGGIRNTRELGQSWTMTTRANIGAGGTDLSIGLQLDFARELERGNAIVAGIKLLDIDYESTVRGRAFLLDAMFLGATAGFRFD
jgi:hypothetical protein